MRLGRTHCAFDSFFRGQPQHHGVGGVDLGVAFLAAVPLGVATGIAVIADEVPQEVIVPRATHLFEASGALPEVARLAAEWFTG